MIKSMTGFGRAEAQDEQHKFTVEIQSPVSGREFKDAKEAEFL